MEIRNIAIIAHVDHGKTTLTDALLRQTGVAEEGVSMDSNALELERGITIYSKNAAIFYRDTKINIVDTPGHADFGSEVERVLRSIDSVLLVVDAQEGPMPQTRFVLKKSLELGLKPIVVINKIDKPAADPARTEEQVLELFLELGASDAQADFPIIYTIGRQGIAKRKLTDESPDLTPLLEMILAHVPPASSDALSAKPLRTQPFNLGYDNFLGRLAVARVYEGTLKTGENVFVKKPSGETRPGKITKMYTFKGLKKVDTNEIIAGDIAMIAGLSDIYIGETITTAADTAPLPAIDVDPPTITLNFLVNNSPFAGREGKFVTSRQIRERLERELEVNVGLRVELDSTETFKVSGRGELHIAILLENMRREGYEMQVSQPQVIFREEEGQKLEPFEEVIVDTPQVYQGAIIERLGVRKFVMKDLKVHDGHSGARARKCGSPLKVRRAGSSVTATNSCSTQKARVYFPRALLVSIRTRGDQEARGRLHDIDGKRQGARLLTVEPAGPRRALHRPRRRGLRRSGHRQHLEGRGDDGESDKGQTALQHALERCRRGHQSHSAVRAHYRARA